MDTEMKTETVTPKSWAVASQGATLAAAVANIASLTASLPGKADASALNTTNVTEAPLYDAPVPYYPVDRNYRARSLCLLIIGLSFIFLGSIWLIGLLFFPFT